jgi:hypothetical protein
MEVSGQFHILVLPQGKNFGVPPPSKKGGENTRLILYPYVSSML